MIGQNWPRGRHPPAQDLGGVAIGNGLKEGICNLEMDFENFSTYL